MEIDQKKLQKVIALKVAKMEEDLIESAIDPLIEGVMKDYIKKFNPLIEKKLKAALDKRIPKLIDGVVKEVVLNASLDIY